MERIVRTILIIALLSSVPALADEERMPPPPYPADAIHAGQHGTLLISVSFTSSGKVADCHVVKSNASDGLTDSTLSWITAQWHSKAQAGNTLQVPVCYQLAAKATPAPKPMPFQPTFTPSWQAAWFRDYSQRRSEWARDFVPPPFIYLQSRFLILSVTFDSSGGVEACAVNESTGDPNYDSFALSWVKKHWHHPAYAGQKAQMSIRFDEASLNGFDVWRSG